MSRRSLHIALTTAVAALALPASASAFVQIDRGIAGARLSNTQAEVRAALGKPVRVIRDRNIFGPTLTFRYRGGLSVFFQGRRNVSAVFTTGRGDRTTRGVGVGSSEAAVRNRVPGVTCDTISGTRSCHTNEFLPGQRITDFRIRNGRVNRVAVSFVID
jgi:hypothetical protein